MIRSYLESSFWRPIPPPFPVGRELRYPDIMNINLLVIFRISKKKILNFFRIKL
jgi:hypothetical protein